MQWKSTSWSRSMASPQHSCSQPPTSTTTSTTATYALHRGHHWLRRMGIAVAVPGFAWQGAEPSPMEAAMRAAVYTQAGDPTEVLSVAEVEEPHPGPGQVRIAVRAAGINPVDWKIVGGMRGGSPS